MVSLSYEVKNPALGDTAQAGRGMSHSCNGYREIHSNFTRQIRSTNYLFSYNLTLQVLAGFGNWKETGNAKPLTAITSYMTQKRPFFPTLFQEHQEFLQAWVWHLIYCPLSPGLF